LVFNHKYAGIVKTWEIVEHIGSSKAFFILLFVYHSDNFLKRSVRMHTLILFLAYLLRKRVCIRSRNVIYKYCIITPVEQSLQPVEYAWWQKQHTTFMGVGRIVSRGGKSGLFQAQLKIFFRGEAKVEKFHFTHSKLRKRPFFG